MKILAGIIAIILGTLIGLYQASKLKSRETYLSEIIMMLEELSVHIRYNASPVMDLLDELKRFEFIKIVKNFLEKSENPLSWKEAWEKSTDEIFALSPDDRDLLKSVGNSLGGSDTTGQLAMLELNKNFFKSRLSDAILENKKKSKMYQSVGLLSGIGIAIIII